MSEASRYDVAIAGGGLAGLCLALEIRRAVPRARILVVERNSHPVADAAHKVGESSVEVASHYFQQVLGLGELLAREVPKFGLRFFMSQGENRDIASRVECGPSHFLTVPSFQIDRGQFENALAARARKLGVDFRDECRISAVELAGGDRDHSITLTSASGASENSELACRWFVDASGRAGLLKKKLGLARASRHKSNAVWFRLDHAIDPDDWSDEESWRSRLEHPRRLSTNHLMGEGYWVWLIPLAKGRTSVGIVSDERLHPFSQLHDFDGALKWLDRHEPQCAAVVRAHADKQMDFLALKHYSHEVDRVFSGEGRWCLTGDAGIFVDPLYSPGSDFIGIANGFACDLIRRDLGGEAVAPIADDYDQTYRSLSRTYMVTYYRQYALMGDARVMTTKIVWDFVMYWGGVALLFFRDKLRDSDFMDGVRPRLERFAHANVGMQAFFRKWADADASVGEPRPGAFVDYSELSFLAELNRNLLEECDDEALLAQLDRNLELVQQLKREIQAEAALLPSPESPVSTHLKQMFETLRSAQGFDEPRKTSLREVGS